MPKVHKAHFFTYFENKSCDIVIRWPNVFPHYTKYTVISFIISFLFKQESMYRKTTFFSFIEFVRRLLNNVIASLEINRNEISAILKPRLNCRVSRISLMNIYVGSSTQIESFHFENMFSYSI